MAPTHRAPTPQRIRCCGVAVTGQPAGTGSARSRARRAGGAHHQGQERGGVEVTQGGRLRTRSYCAQTGDLSVLATAKQVMLD